jgi:hypothetical protein
LPSQLRDAVLSSDGGIALPESSVNREYHQQQQLMLYNAGMADNLGQVENEKLLQIARSVALPSNREQPRVKIFQQQRSIGHNVVAAQKRTAR